MIPAPGDEYPLNEVFSENRVTQPALLFNRQEWQVLHQSGGIDSNSVPRGNYWIPDFDAFHAATWRIFSRDVTSRAALPLKLILYAHPHTVGIVFTDVVALHTADFAL